MDNSLVSERLKEYWLPLVLGLAGLVFLVYGAISLYAPKKDKPDILFEASGSSTGPEAKKSNSTITVDVEGGVLKPGVYDLPADSRIQDALIAAGGMSSAADRAVVSKSLNLAAKLVDGAKIYIPVEGDPSHSSGLAGSGQAGQDVAGIGVININAASSKDLDSLPGIGEVTAEKIISSRPYGSVDELLTKKIVGQKVFEQIKDKISVY